jgi:hypothetical protein
VIGLCENRGVLRLARLLLPVVATLVVAAPATAATTHRDTTVATVKKASGKIPTLVYTGTVKSTVLGRGTVHQVVRLDGLKVSGQFTITYAHGTVRGTVAARAKITLKGATFTGTERITGGTGRYKGASGSGSYSGTGPLDMSGATFRQTGTIRF